MEGKSVFRIKSLIAVLTCLVFAIAVLITIIIIVGFKNAVEEQTSSPTPATSEELDETEALYYQEKTNAENKPSAQEYIAIIDQEIATTSASEEQAQLYMRRAEELYSRQNVGQGNFSDQILSDLHKAEEIAPSAETAIMLYNFERVLGNSETANYYYNLSIERGYEKQEDSA